MYMCVRTYVYVYVYVYAYVCGIALIMFVSSGICFIGDFGFRQ